ncbi:MAG TPA: BON domain-containing protein [Polyangiaceae bacterium]|nr:BON domain-containing protein [Polyangiaceae bacterium]
MKPFWMALCAVALGACAPASRPAPQAPETPARPLPPPPPPPDPLIAPEGHGPEAIRERLFREHPRSAAVVASLRIVEDDGAVTLVGFTPDQQTCHALLASVRHVPGVRAVRNELIVLERPEPQVTAGSRTGEAIRSWLRRERPDAVGADDSFKVYESDGLVTLYGKVNDEQSRRDLVSRVKQMPDVKQVDDRLEVGAPAAPAPVGAAAPAPHAQTAARALR